MSEVPRREGPSNASLLMGVHGVNDPQYRPQNASKKPESQINQKKRRKSKRKPTKVVAPKSDKVEVKERCYHHVEIRVLAESFE